MNEIKNFSRFTFINKNQLRLQQKKHSIQKQQISKKKKQKPASIS